MRISLLAIALATAVTPLFGKLSDIYGRRTILLICIAIFIVGSVACALAPTMWALIAARALQGLGGGGILPIAQTIIADLVSPRERPPNQEQSSFEGSLERAGRMSPGLSLDPAGSIPSRPSSRSIHAEAVTARHHAMRSSRLAFASRSSKSP